MDHTGYINFTMKQMENKEFKEKILNLVKTADIGIDDIQVEEEDVPIEVVEIIEKLALPEFLKDKSMKEGTFKSVSLNMIHRKYDSYGQISGTVVFDLEREESKGTRKFFAMSAPIIDTLENGKILIIDELDASLHPILTQHLIKLFHDENVNKKNAQLVFATHDTNLLKKTIFRRDQIWLCEKDKIGSTDLFSLAQFKNVRKNEDFEKQYIHGKYGAIPYLSKFEFEEV
jgi:AAA15 family ATPase/GTPase